MQFMDDDDVDDIDSHRHAVGFAFGPGYGWERFTVDPLPCCGSASAADMGIPAFWLGA